jgi:hypothetical protein
VRFKSHTFQGLVLDALALPKQLERSIPCRQCLDNLALEMPVNGRIFVTKNKSVVYCHLHVIERHATTWQLEYTTESPMV